MADLLFRDDEGNLHPVATVDAGLIERAKAWIAQGGSGEGGGNEGGGAEPPAEEPEPSGITISPTDSISDAIKDAKNGENINLQKGTYYQRMWVDKPVNIQGYKGDKWVVDGRKHLNTSWQVGNAGLLMGKFPKTNLPFIWCGNHPQTPAGHANLMRPEVVTYKGRPLLWRDSASNLTPGTFHIDGGTGEESTIYIRPFEHADDQRYEYAAYPNLLSGPVGISGVRVAGGTLRYASSTCHTGLLNAVWDESVLEDLLVQYANTNGITLGGNNGSKPVCGLTARNVRAEYNGQSGWWGAVCDSLLEHCTNSYNNWKGFAVNWEAGSKFERSTGSTWRHWLCEGNKAVSFWFDIQNYRNIIEHITIRDGLKAGAMFEHYFKDNVVQHVTVDNIAKWNGISDAVTIQSNVERNKFIDFKLSRAEKGARYKKKEPVGNRDMGSGFNEFDLWVFSQIDQQNIYIEGDRNVKPDVFKFDF